MKRAFASGFLFIALLATASPGWTGGNFYFFNETGGNLRITFEVFPQTVPIPVPPFVIVKKMCAEHSSPAISHGGYWNCNSNCKGYFRLYADIKRHGTVRGGKVYDGNGSFAVKVCHNPDKPRLVLVERNAPCPRPKIDSPGTKPDTSTM